MHGMRDPALPKEAVTSPLFLAEERKIIRFPLDNSRRTLQNDSCISEEGIVLKSTPGVSAYQLSFGNGTADPAAEWSMYEHY